jgi:Raf kinase inhibitor-like YbhB/YbcL family protein
MAAAEADAHDAAMKRILPWFPAFVLLAAELPALDISTPDFCPCERIPARFTADGRNVSPELRIGAVPEAAHSLALIVEDPDAPDGTFTHWLLWNIDPGISVVERGKVPRGAAAGRNDFGTLSYRGPDPPSGTHRYFFRLYALDAPLDLPPGADRRQLEAAMKGRILAEAEMRGYYDRRRR